MQNVNAHLLQKARPIDNPWLGVIEVIAVAGAIFLAALVRIPLPWTPVPMTLQTLPVIAAAYVVGRDRAAFGIALYLLFGTVQQWFQADGIQMFAAAFGPTAGYLVAFALVPFVASAIRRPALAVLASTLLIYAIGTAGLCLWKGFSPITGLMLGVVPFIPGDIAKGVAAYLVARRAALAPDPAA